MVKPINATAQGTLPRAGFQALSLCLQRWAFSLFTVNESAMFRCATESIRRSEKIKSLSACHFPVSVNTKSPGRLCPGRLLYHWQE